MSIQKMPFDFFNLSSRAREDARVCLCVCFVFRERVSEWERGSERGGMGLGDKI
jgi:hypothetical protein